MTHPTAIWATLLSAGEGSSFSLPEDDPALEYAEQMQGTGLLVCTGEREWTLSSKGMQTLTIVDGLRDLSLSRL
ncbi:hypothetical protein [Prosthecobacter sp.]|uniref:hypothetical protein n=1 Tax=Prosthecobacter sp. TaxID=1965333 RepID=UPI0037845A89